MATSSLLTVPDLVLFLALLLLAVRTGWFPTGGMTSAGFEDLGVGGKLKDLAVHLFLPCAGLVLATLPPLLRHVRSAMIEVLDAPFVRAARAHGISERRVLLRYAFPVAANPLITLFGYSLAAMLSAPLANLGRGDAVGCFSGGWKSRRGRITFRDGSADSDGVTCLGNGKNSRGRSWCWRRSHASCCSRAFLLRMISRRKIVGSRSRRQPAFISWMREELFTFAPSFMDRAMRARALRAPQRIRSRFLRYAGSFAGHLIKSPAFSLRACTCSALHSPREYF